MRRVILDTGLNPRRRTPAAPAAPFNAFIAFAPIAAAFTPIAAIAPASFTTWRTDSFKLLCCFLFIKILHCHIYKNDNLCLKIFKWI